MVPGPFVYLTGFHGTTLDFIAPALLNKHENSATLSGSFPATRHHMPRNQSICMRKETKKQQYIERNVTLAKKLNELFKAQEQEKG